MFCLPNHKHTDKAMKTYIFKVFYVVTYLVFNVRMSRYMSNISTFNFISFGKKSDYEILFSSFDKTFSSFIS